MSKDDELVSGIALTALSLTVAALMKMQEMKLLTPDDQNDIQDNALQGLEHFVGVKRSGIARSSATP